ncbi:MAG: complex I subunit 1 family protein [Bdellovibrionota bacterium]
MNADLNAISPLAAYLGSFFSATIPGWVLVSLAVFVHGFLLTLPPIVAIGFMDRKFGADIQMRIGPNRVPLYGFFQVIADAIKLLFKENLEPVLQERFLFRWGIPAAIVVMFAAVGSIPMSQSWAISNLESGLVAVLTALGVSNLCIFWAAYSAESQWSVLSSFRIIGTLVTYIIPVAVALVPPVLVAGSPNFDQIVRVQGGMPWNWIVLHNPGTLLSFLCLFFGLSIWQGRTPFDHHDSLVEVAGGVSSEFSGLRHGFVSILKTLSMFLSCALIVTTYLGGWRTPLNLESFGRAANLVEWLFFITKVFFLVFLSIWIRWSLPRMRIDQMIKLSWRCLVPVGLFSIFFVAVWMVIFNGRGLGDFL